MPESTRRQNKPLATTKVNLNRLPSSLRRELLLKGYGDEHASEVIIDGEDFNVRNVFLKSMHEKPIILNHGSGRLD